ncbi:uncharacterized protein F5891DRAFT_1131406 [Suillus fuscotomentosus]|uniref:CxC2-like cysteine cluster KDZ transposase-associated domain-containing protein n=1 Tax=Suillus fuscotomentosus TaxID=1912939 RepID=A0AAD4DSB0_9AGAM|nr:uncharacterized protein F5891DRAFT_1131406 [Suillus fuscotomentosus]KAG1893035.1 hypothetical protein F5891DRAFT_1131406 [Suillus fuscotomentosus]
MVGGQRRQALKHYQRDFYAHNAAASKAVNNDTNDVPRHTHDVQQRKHSSFETGQSGRLNVSSAYYTIPNSPGKRRRGDSEVLLETTEFNFTTLNDFPDNLQNDTPEFALRLWESDANLFLEEFLRLEGQGDYSQDVCVCGEEAVIYRCQDCHGSEMFCHLCMVRVHERQPFHKMEHWDGISFNDITSKSMGIHLQLGHTSGVCCDNPLPAFNDNFVIIHYNGIYKVGLDFCGCTSAQLHIVQLLHVHLFPATTVDPKTATTFWALEYFQMLSFESKVSMFEFYKTAARLTDNTGIHVPKWRFIKQMQHAGQGHHPKGIAATEPGACAVLCPACPHVGKNLPDGWENAPSEIQFLYALFLGIDANFRLACRNVSSAMADPGLNHGYAFFMSSCSSHNAVNLADTRVSCGLTATGAGTINCARHNFKWPCSISDLQKGEQCIMFTFYMRSLLDIVALNISYDIACQWSKHIWTRMSAFPHQYHIKHHEKSIVFLIPKFHLPAHITKCQTSFSFNLIKGIGRTDGEAPERGWADINPIATSTREMGPGSRCDTLDNHFNDWNWKKICAMSEFNFLPKVQERVNDLTNFEASLATDELAEWRKDIEAWEKDRSRPNPFEDRATTTMTQAAVCLALSMAEATEIERGNDVSLHDDISPSVLISSGLELEDQQRCLEFDAKVVGQHATDVQKGKLLQQVNALRQCIDTWGRVQLLYMPGISHLWLPYDVATEAKYSTSRGALLNLASRLGKNDNWERSLKPLDKQKDAVPLKHDNGRTMGQQSISWIWKTSGSNSNELGLQDYKYALTTALCVEWCKARAQAHCWEEEVQLLCEEMRRVIAFLDWHAGWWDTQGSQRTFSSLQAGESALAYAQCQANLRQKMAVHFKSMWAANSSWQAPLAVDLHS